MPGRRPFSLLDTACLVAVVALGVVVLGPHVDREEAARVTRPVPETLAVANHLSLAGDVLWWTTGAALYRATRSLFPGAGTLVEQAPPGQAYGDLAAPYLVVNDLVRHRSWIRRLDDPARVADAGTWIGERDLVTDGAEAYWTDGVIARGIRLAPVAATTIAAGGGRVYLAAGRTIRSMPATGGPARVEVTTRTAVAALAAHATGLYWAEADASIHSLSGQYQVPVAGQRVTALAHDGHRLLWSACDNHCHLAQRSEVAATGTVNISTVDVGADPHDLAGDGRTTVLIGGGRVVRWTEPPRPGHGAR